MGRGHIPFGYRIKNGSAEIVPEEAEQIRKIYSAYIAGKPYIEAAKCAGLSMTHASVKWLLQNRHYIGDEFYPAIIDRHTFDAAEAERLHRLDIMGRTYRTRPVVENLKVKTHFTMKQIVEKNKDPYDQAAYIYSLIESEE